MTESELNARALIAADLFQEGKVTRSECFRVEMDRLLGEDTGPIQFQDNSDFIDGTM